MNYFSLLDDIITEFFWLSVFGGSVSEEEFELFFQPTHMARMGICDTIRQDENAYLSSRASTSRINAAVRGEEMFSVVNQNNEFKQSRLSLAYNKTV